MVIPSYWSRESTVGWQQGDAIYDHPTPLDNEGALPGVIQSLKILKDKGFQLVVIAVATAQDIETRVEKKVASIIKSVSATVGVEVSLFGPSHLEQVHSLLVAGDKGEYTGLLKLRGYSDIRNLCLFMAHIFGSEAAVLIDDDEVFEDPEFMSKAKEFIGKKIGGKTASAVAGYYLQPGGDYRLKKTAHPWMKHWGQYDSMDKAFARVIGTEPRLKETPFVFGGNMIVHRNLFSAVPFDPNITRGEDIDFLINARMFGFTFFLDNQLSIRHLPPPKAQPAWMQLRQDIYRFIYERAKIESQVEVAGMTRVYPEDLDPYPGGFLKRDLEDKIEKSCQLLSEEYLARGDRQSSEQALNNIALAKTDALPKYDPFQSLCRLQKRWQELMRYTDKRKVRLRMRAVVEGVI